MEAVAAIRSVERRQDRRTGRVANMQDAAARVRRLEPVRELPVGGAVETNAETLQKSDDGGAVGGDAPRDVGVA